MIISESSVKITELDKMAYDSTAQLIKAAIPYTNTSVARMLAVIAKFLELKKTLDYVKEPELNICALLGQKPKPEEMLNDLKKYCDPSQVEIIDRMLNILNMGKFYEKYKELEKSPEFHQMMNMVKNTMNTGTPDPPPMSQFMNQINTPSTIDNLKNMLSPEQRQMFDTLIAMNQHRE